MRMSDWSSDVCSSDLAVGQVAQESEVVVAVAAEDLVAEALGALHHGGAEGEGAPAGAGQHREIELRRRHAQPRHRPGVGPGPGDRHRDAYGKRVSVRGDLGGRRLLTKKYKTNT